MLFVDSPIFSYKLGNHIFYARGCNRYVLCNSVPEAKFIISTLGLNGGKVEQVATLNETSKVTHLNGSRVTVTHMSKKYICDTLFAVGVPKGIDTCSPLHFVFKRTDDDIN